MPITFHPDPGMVLMCDFTTGFIEPEMVKRRHVIVISPRYRRRTGLCLVVPLSTRPPNPVEPHHYEIPAGRYVFLDPDQSSWVKADMLTCVCFDRLDRVKENGKWASPSLSADDFRAVKRAVVAAIGMSVTAPAQTPRPVTPPIAAPAAPTVIAAAPGKPIPPEE